MVAVNIKGIRGKVPRISPRLLQPNFASEALNTKLTSGRIDPIRGLSGVHTSALASVVTAYRYRNSATDYWLAWSRVVDVVRSPTAQDTRNRLYYTGDGEPRMTSFADAISGPGPYPAAWYVLGVYIPTTAMTVGATGGSGTQETRSYLYTFVTQYGEEGAPSPATVSTQFANATSWDLSGMEVAPPNSGTVSAAASLGGGLVRVTLDTTRGLSAYEEVTFAGATGMTDLNATLVVDNVVSATQLDVRLTTSQTYTAGGTWTRRAPHNTTSMKKRIYRTVAGSTAYQFVAEIAAVATTFTDNIAGSALGNVIPTYSSFTPPKNMHSLVALANGALAGIAGNQLCFSEQYKPYSWPIANRYAFTGTGVALCAAGNSVILLTDSYPVVAVASVPEAASLARLPVYAPCVSKQGVADVGGGCLFPSYDGLYLAQPSGAKNVTNGLYRYDEWQALQPSTFKAAFYDQRYFAAHSSIAPTAPRILVLDANEPDSVSEVDLSVGAMYSNLYDGKLYVVQGNKIYQWDADDSNRLLSFWQSAEFQSAPPVNFSCAQVHAVYSDIVPADTSVAAANALLLASADNIEGALGASVVGMYPVGGTNLLEPPAVTVNRVQFNLVSNGQIVFTKGLFSSEPFRLPAGFRSERHQVQIFSSVPVYSITMAQSMDELAQASA